jgi:uracil-DNA glycosylase family 4
LNEKIARLQDKIIRCKLCPRLVAHRRRVAQLKAPRYRDWDYWGRPVPSLGDPAAQLLIIGLAPAAHGGNRTGRMFTGDRSGDWLYRALYTFGFANQPTSDNRMDGLKLINCYVTASARCAPPENKPSKEELFNCRSYLLKELLLLNRVKVVVALGRIAFDTYLACRKYRQAPVLKKALRFGHGLVYHLPEGIALVASYHPSQQNTLTGRLTRPMFHAVFRQARRWIQN